jgi:hypothetical protein
MTLIDSARNDAVPARPGTDEVLGSDDALAAYLFVYFAGEDADDGESIHLAVSRGNDALHWDDLNGGRPVLTSTHGTRGLRDPFILRSAEGDRFFLIATDLKVYPSGSFAAPQETGSRHLEIWESSDLVTWSDQRHVEVSGPEAGNTWAPEAHYDAARGEYLVYWASNLYDAGVPAAERVATDSYNRMLCATTRDFRTFSTPQVWVDVRRGPGLGMIDSTVIEHEGVYYRATKDEATMLPRLERSVDLRAQVHGELPDADAATGWALVARDLGLGQDNGVGGAFTAGEGPTIFRANDGDVSTGGRPAWYMFVDQPSYHGGRGYVPFVTDDLDSGVWTSVADRAQLPASPRHGTVLPITAGEAARVRAALGAEAPARSAVD